MSDPKPSVMLPATSAKALAGFPDGKARSRTLGRARHALGNSVTFVSLVWVLLVLVLAVFGDLLAPYNPTVLELSGKFTAPSPSHVFGTDQYGRDILSRVMVGSRYALLSAGIAMAVAAPIGSLFGLLAGYHGRWLDTVLMRLVDGWLAFPSLILAMGVAAVLQPNIVTSSIAIGVAGIPWYARTVRSQTLAVKAQDFITAAHCIGADSARILLVYILPNVWGPILVLLGLQVGNVILTFAGLSFIGLGAQAPTPEWGLMVTEGRQFTVSGEWWIPVFPGVAIMLTVVAFNVIGDALRDIFDPEL